MYHKILRIKQTLMCVIIVAFMLHFHFYKTVTFLTVQYIQTDCSPKLKKEIVKTLIKINI